MNYVMYSTPEQISTMRQDILVQLEHSIEDMENDSNTEELDGFFDKVTEDVETHLTESRYKQHSLYRMLGNFLTLIGAMFMFRARKLGFHLYIGGSILSIVFGFVAFGFGMIGWAFNILYIFAALLFGFIYFKSLKYLN